MKVKWGALAVAGSGKINGFVASKNRGGAYFRTKTTPSNPQTTAQQGARALLGSLSTAWSGLTEASRLSFNNAVANFATTDIFGDIRNPSGINLYVKLNSNLSNSGQSLLDVAPEKIEVPYSQIQDVTMDVSTQNAQMVLADGALDLKKVLVFATAPQTQGTKFVKNKLRKIGTFEVNIDTIDLITAYSEKFGAFSLGQNIVFSMYPIVETGQAGIPQTIKATIVA